MKEVRGIVERAVVVGDRYAVTKGLKSMFVDTPEL